MRGTVKSNCHMLILFLEIFVIISTASIPAAVRFYCIFVVKRIGKCQNLFWPVPSLSVGELNFGRLLGVYYQLLWKGEKSKRCSDRHDVDLRAWMRRPRAVEAEVEGMASVPREAAGYDGEVSIFTSLQTLLAASQRRRRDSDTGHRGLIAASPPPARPTAGANRVRGRGYTGGFRG